MLKNEQKLVIPYISTSQKLFFEERVKNNEEVEKKFENFRKNISEFLEKEKAYIFLSIPEYSQEFFDEKYFEKHYSDFQKITYLDQNMIREEEKIEANEEIDSKFRKFEKYLEEFFTDELVYAFVSFPGGYFREISLERRKK